VPDRLTEGMETLYAAGPEEFMALRTRLVATAKEEGDKAAAAEIGKLRKPSVAAWAVNLVARADPDVVEELVDLGGQMRDAQSRLDTAALTGMRRDRDAAVDAFVRAATAAGEITSMSSGTRHRSVSRTSGASLPISAPSMTSSSERAEVFTAYRALLLSICSLRPW